MKGHRSNVRSLVRLRSLTISFIPQCTGESMERQHKQVPAYTSLQAAPSSELAGPKVGLGWNISVGLNQCPPFSGLSLCRQTPVARSVRFHPSTSLARHGVTETSSTLEG